jgi:lipid-binding SYLF domain-containing protein
VIHSEAEKTLNELYASQPATRDKVAKAAGYGYFSTVNVNVLLLSTENGYGVVHDNSSGKDTYMKMAGGGVGVGMGLKDYRAIFIFTDAGVMQMFITKGWNVGGQADAAAKTKNEGAAANAAAEPIPGMEVYQFTKQGIALQATVQGSKYWRDDKLNAP